MFYVRPSASSYRSGEYLMFFKPDANSLPVDHNAAKYIQPSIAQALYKPALFPISKLELNR